MMINTDLIFYGIVIASYLSIGIIISAKIADVGEYSLREQRKKMTFSQRLRSYQYDIQFWLDVITAIFWPIIGFMIMIAYIYFLLKDIKVKIWN